MADDTKNTTTGSGADGSGCQHTIADGELAGQAHHATSTAGSATTKSGTVLRRLSPSAYNTLVNGGLADAIRVRARIELPRTRWTLPLPVRLG
jgi:hypothetical protein